MKGRYDFWIPKYRFELIEWLRNNFPADQRRFSKMTKAQLYAIYFEVRKSLTK